MDSILNEMIKHGRYFLLPSLEKIFNDILNSGKFPTEWNIAVIKPFTKRKVIEDPQQITEESLWQVVWANCLHQFYNPCWISISKSITFSTQNNLDSDQTLEQQIVYSSCNNSFISTPNNMQSFMLDLLVELALAERDSKNAVFSFFCRWDLVCRPRVPSEDRGNWSWRLSLVCLVMSMRYIFDID